MGGEDFAVFRSGVGEFSLLFECDRRAQGVTHFAFAIP